MLGFICWQERPPKLKTPAVLIGSEFLSKSLFIEDARLGTVMDIVRGEIDPHPGLEIGIVGHLTKKEKESMKVPYSGVTFFLDTENQIVSSIFFAEKTEWIDIVDVEGDGICEFMNRGGTVTPASLINHRGKEVWAYGKRGVNDMAMGDLDGDGVPEFVVGFNARGGVHLLNKDGKRKWKKPDSNVWHVEVVDTDQNGLLEIIHSNARGLMTIRNRDGEIIRRVKPGSGYFSKFSLCRWPTLKDREYVLHWANNMVWIVDFAGETVTNFSLGKFANIRAYRIWGTPVRFLTDFPEYFAVLIMYRASWHRSMLYLYDPQGTIVYQELLPEWCKSIAVLPSDKSGREILLVGGEGKVWQYEVYDAPIHSHHKQSPSK
jgi:hypothetical protein